MIDATINNVSDQLEKERASRRYVDEQAIKQSLNRNLSNLSIYQRAFLSVRVAEWLRTQTDEFVSTGVKMPWEAAATLSASAVSEIQQSLAVELGMITDSIIDEEEVD